MLKRRKINWKNIIILILIFVIVIVLGVTFVIKYFSKDQEPTIISTPTVEPTPTPVVDNALKGEGNNVFTDTESILLLANKKHKLPDGYVPSNLVTIPSEYDHYNYGCQLKEEAANALVTMFQAANAEGLYLEATTTYRDESFQTTLYNDLSDV